MFTYLSPSHMTWMHDFFFSMFTKWRISNWSLIGQLISISSGDQENMWLEESVSLLLWYFIIPTETMPFLGGIFVMSVA